MTKNWFVKEFRDIAAATTVPMVEAVTMTLLSLSLNACAMASWSPVYFDELKNRNI